MEVRRKKGWLKNIIAVGIGIVTGFLLHLILSLPLVMLFGTEDGLPHDLEIIIAVFTAFIAGSLAGSLVPRYGWLYGALTQFLKMLLSPLTVAVVIFMPVTDAELGEAAYFLRLSFFAIAAAGVGGGIAERYRVKIWSLLGTISVFVAARFGWLLFALDGLLYSYFLYLGGKALFEDEGILRALLYWVVIGPLVSLAASFALIVIFFVGAKVFRALHTWYADDLGLDPIYWT